MGVVAWLMRIFSVAFHILLGAAMLAISSVALLTRADSLQFQVLPWRGTVLTWCLFGSGLASILLALLALRRRFPVLFVVWTLVVFVMLLRGYFLSSYNFAFGGSFGSAVLLVLGSLIAVAGSVLLARQEARQLRQRSMVA